MILLLYVESKKIKLIETGNRLVVASGWGGRNVRQRVQTP